MRGAAIQQAGSVPAASAFAVLAAVAWHPHTRVAHPSIESLVRSHVVGKPVDRVQIAADETMHQRLEEERQLFARLSLEQLQELADDNQRLLARPARWHGDQHIPLIEATIDSAPVGAESTAVPAKTPADD